MRAAVVHEPGTTPVVGDFADPEGSDDRQVMQVVAAGVHPVVRGLASGRHYGSHGIFPLVPGVDCVARTADGVLRFAGFVTPPWGTIAERVAVPGGMPLPDGADPVAVAGGVNPGLSSWLPLATRRDEIGALGTVLVLGATGVAGRMAVQIARLLGADRVVAVGRDAGRLGAVADLGAEPVHLDGGADAIAAALEGDTPSTVLDFVWGPAAEATWAALARHGLEEDTADIEHVEIGSLAGATAALPAALLRSRKLRIRGAGAGSAPMGQVMRELPALMEHIAAGRVVVPAVAYPLEQVAQAWAHGAGERAVVTF